MVERDGKLNVVTVENRQSDTLCPIIYSNIKETAILYADEQVGYARLKNIYDHKFVKHTHKQYVEGRIHTNTIEGFWSLLKCGIFGIYHFTSKKHLHYMLTSLFSDTIVVILHLKVVLI